MKHNIFVTCLLTLTGSTLALADDRGFYLGGSLGYSSVDSVADSQFGLLFSAPLPPLSLPSLDAAGFDEVPFDDDDIAWSGFIGYRLNPYLNFQLSYTDLGGFDADTFSPDSSGTLDITEYALSAKLQYPLTARLTANWWLGLTRSTFDADGDARAVVGVPGVFVVVSAPYTDPDDETGYLWGFGADWALTDQLSLELNYLKHEAQVLDVDTVNLGLLFAL